MSKNKNENENENPFRYSCNKYHMLLKNGAQSHHVEKETFGFFTRASSSQRTFEEYRANLETLRLACEEERYFDNPRPKW